MKQEIFSSRMESIGHSDSKGRYEDCLQSVRTLKQDLHGDNGTPEQLGWTLYYEFKCLFQLERHEAGLNLMMNQFDQVEISEKNSGWMCSVAGEMAARLGRTDQIIDFGRKCLQFRKSLHDPVSEIQAAQTFCRLLEWNNGSDHNFEFALHELNLGVKYRALLALCDGIENLLKNFQLTQDSKIFKIVENALSQAFSWENLDHQDEQQGLNRLYEITMKANECLNLDFKVPALTVTTIDGLDSSQFDSLCVVGSSADDLLRYGDFREAIVRYADCVREMNQLRCMDSFIMAKVTLGTMIALIKEDSLGHCFEVWNASVESSNYGIGIAALEGAQTSTEDLVIYFLVSAYLHSKGSQNPKTAKLAVDSLMEKCWQFAKEKRPEWVTPFLQNWRICFEEISEDQVPKEWGSELALKAGTQTIPPAKTLFLPHPDQWKITWATEPPIKIQA